MIEKLKLFWKRLRCNHVYREFGRCRATGYAFGGAFTADFVVIYYRCSKCNKQKRREYCTRGFLDK